MSKPLASLSLDLDNKWSYLKTHGDPGWETFPSYLDIVVPRFLRMLEEHKLRITVFIVGQDAALEKNRKSLAAISEAGHEIGNHSFQHEPWLHLYSKDELKQELENAEAAILDVTGQRPCGFRGPGYSRSKQLYELLAQRGYAYDGSTLPTFLGPIARMYYFFTTKLSSVQKEDRKELFGQISDCCLPLRTYPIQTPEGSILEIPVTTMPLFRLPFHFSYIHYLAQFSSALALLYFRLSLRLCRMFRVCPSLLLHPLDFIGAEDAQELAFFPGMKSTRGDKMELMNKAFQVLTKHFEVVTMKQHATAVWTDSSIPISTSSTVLKQVHTF